MSWCMRFSVCEREKGRELRSSVAVNGVGYRARVHDGDEPSTGAVAARGDGTVRGDKHREHQ